MRDLTQIKALSLLEQLALILPSRAGSTLSLNSLREDIQVAFDTIKNWIEALERLYFCFRISAYSKKIGKSIKKEQKLYLWDWTEVKEDGARFENMVASHLLKAIHAWNDIGYGRFELHFWRDFNGKEVDFLMTNDRIPIVLIECKKSDTHVSDSLIRLGSQLSSAAGHEIPKIQLVDLPDYHWKKDQIRVVDAARFLSALV
jgi:predicted AAA+ superfamily ATPase